MKSSAVCLILICLLLVPAHILVDRFVTGYIIDGNDTSSQVDYNTNVLGGEKVFSNLKESKDNDDLKIINSTSVVLVTGDLVHLYYLSDGSVKVAIEPVDPTNFGRNFRIFEDPRGLYVIPNDVDLRKYDLDLFNIKLLAKQANITSVRDKIRVILRPVEPVKVNEFAAFISKLAKDVKIDHKVKVIHKELGYVSLAIDAKDRVKVKEFFERFSRLQFDKVWLDKVYYIDVNVDDSAFRPMLDVSVPRVGAEWVWTRAQLSGEGVRIAILDTGIDFTHKDFHYMNGTSKILEAISMVDWPPEEKENPIDLHGHGTHVSGIAAGTGLTWLNYDYVSTVAHPLVKRYGNDESAMVAGNGTHLAVVWQSDISGNIDIWILIYNGVEWYGPLQLTNDAHEDAWPYVAFLRDNRILVMWSSNRIGSWEIWYKVYINGRWSDDKQLTTNPNDYNYLPAFTELPDGKIAMISVCKFVNSGGCGLEENHNKTDIWFFKLSMTDDGTLSLEESRPITEAAPNQWLFSRSLIYSSNKTLWAFWDDLSNFNFETNWGGYTKMYYSISSDMGMKWTEYELYSCEGCVGAQAIELPNGTILAFFQKDDTELNVQDTTYYLKLTEDTWSGPFWLPTDTWHQWRPSAAHGPAGFYIVVTHWSDDDYGNDIYIIPPKPAYQGVAPKANLLVAKVLNRWGWGCESWIINGIEWAVSRGADIISMSLGGPPTDGEDPLSQAVNWAFKQGVLVVVAAGNYGDYFGVSTPGAAEGALTVGAVDDHDNLAWFTSRGPTLDFRVKPEMVAPGVGICSSVPLHKFEEPYACWSGTSMSTPHVAGAAAIAKQFFRRDYGFEAPPYVLKNWLITFATDDLGYDVYSQGAGRINLTKTFYRDLVDHGGAWIHPAVINFGYMSNEEAKTAEFYVEEYAQSRRYDVHVKAIDILSGRDVSGAIEVDLNSFSLSEGDRINITVTIKSDAPTGVYSGKIKLVDNFGEIYHVIFGAYVGLELTIHKIPWEGLRNERAVAGDPVMVVILDPDSEFELEQGWQWSWFDENGIARFILPEGTYEILTSGLYNDEIVFIAHDNLHLTTSTKIRLDERNTHHVTFNPNKPRQVYAETYHGFKSGPICPSSAVPCYGFSLTEIRWYPRTANVYYSYSELMWSVDRYVYYPLDDVNPSDPGTIITSTWHDLIYVEKKINNPINRIADYTQLIKKYTEYRTHATPKQSAGLAKFMFTNHEGAGATYAWHTNIPQSRVEVVSPDAFCLGLYWKRGDLPWIDTPYWEYFGLDLRNIEPGSTIREVWGEQPLFPTVKYVDSYRDEVYYDVSIEAETFTDSNYYYQNVFHSRYPLEDIGIEVYRNGEPVDFWMIVWRWFWGNYYVRIEDQTPPARYQLRTRAYQYQTLSTETILEYEFTLNSDGSISWAPRLIDVNVKDLGLNNTLMKHIVNMEFMLMNETRIQSLTFEYSIDGGISWIQVPIIVVSPNTYNVIFTVYGEERYISMRINATDIRGLKSSTTVLNGLIVKGVLTLADFPKPFVGSELKASFIVGNTAPHGPLKWQAWTSDVLGAIGIAARLGLEATTGDVSQHIDTHIATYSSGITTIYWNRITYRNVISVGGKYVNIFTYHYEDHIPFKIIRRDSKVYLYSSLTGKYYSGENVYEDYAVIALIYDEYNQAYIMLVFGITGRGSLAASMVLQYFDYYQQKNILSGRAIIIKWIDKDRDAIVEKTDEIILIEKWD